MLLLKWRHISQTVGKTLLTMWDHWTGNIGGVFTLGWFRLHLDLMPSAIWHDRRLRDTHMSMISSRRADVIPRGRDGAARRYPMRRVSIHDWWNYWAQVVRSHVILLVGLLSHWCHVTSELSLYSLCLRSVGLVLIVHCRNLMMDSCQQRMEGIGCRKISAPWCVTKTLSSQVWLVDSKWSIGIIRGWVRVVCW